MIDPVTRDNRDRDHDERRGPDHDDDAVYTLATDEIETFIVNQNEAKAIDRNVKRTTT